jgi:hypothetical protein
LAIPLGHVVAVAQLAAVPLIMATAMIIEDLPQALRSRSTEVHTFGRTAAAPHETGPHQTGPHQTGPRDTEM